jgi:rubrerythrin
MVMDNKSFLLEYLERKIMDVILFAREQEDQLAQYYSELTALTRTKTVCEILRMIGDAHANHRRILDAITQVISPLLHPSRILTNGSALIRKMEQYGLFSSNASDSIELYQGIMDVELQIEQFYKERRCHLDAPFCKDIFMGLGREAHKHYILMHNLCELLTNEDTFFEDIEFQRTSKYKTCAC